MLRRVLMHVSVPPLQRIEGIEKPKQLLKRYLVARTGVPQMPWEDGLPSIFLANQRCGE